MAKSLAVPFADPPWHQLDQHNPCYRASHRKLQKFLRQYVDSELRPHAQEWEENGEVPEEVVKRHASLGLLAVASYSAAAEYANGIALPAGIEGREWDAYHDMIVTDELARCGYLGVVWGINCGSNVGGPILASYCTPAQKKAWLTPLLAGQQRHCLAVTEPEAGSDVSNLQSTAEKTADGKFYVVNGFKKWITQGWWADWVLTIVRTGQKGPKGLSALMIDMRSDGISKKRMHNSGVKASGSTFITFDDVRVPVDNLIGKEGQAFEILMSGFERERVWLAATSNRLCRVALEDSYEYALSRETFGRPLISNQVIRAKITNMALRIEATWAFLESVIRMQSTLPARQSSKWAAMVKVRAANDLEYVCREAQQVFGGAGYTRGGRAARVEQISRDLRCLVVSGGSEEVMIDMVAKQGLPKVVL